MLLKLSGVEVVMMVVNMEVLSGDGSGDEWQFGVVLMLRLLW